MIKISNKGKISDYVYDISLDGTVVNALGMNIAKQTDGFNFQLPSKYRYNEDNPYISTGESRETEKGKKYVGFKADVAEFNDLYMKDFHYAPNAVNKMGLGIDEVVSATINFARKNYADYFPDKPFPKDVKLVGNTIKSKKMPEYIKVFLEKGVRLLLNFKGKEFLDEYYDYIEKIYNYNIPIKQIASKGKIKKSLSSYIEDCKSITKAGRPKSRQAWMELAVKYGLNVNMGETIYYINTGNSKSQADVKKVTHYYKKENTIEGEIKIDVQSSLKKEYAKMTDYKANHSFNDFVKEYYPNILIEDEIILNCEIVPREVVESDKDYFCEEGKEYNVPKYVEQFNNRIKPLLVCFNKDIREKILISNPIDKPFFTEEECTLCSGQPNKPTDQDTYEALMTMDDKEIAFWNSHPEWKIPFLKECNMDWDKILSDYKERKENERKLGIDKIRAEFDKEINKLSVNDIYSLLDDGILPKSIERIVDIDTSNGNLISKEYPDIIICSIAEMIDYLTNEIEMESDIE